CRRSCRIVLQTICSPVRRTKVQERVHVDLVVKQPHTSTHHDGAILLRLISKTESGAEIVPIGRVNFVNSVALDLDSSELRREDCQVLLVIMQWPVVVVAQTEVQV